jgi:tetratricopeptide (TPR) repeat protein
MEAHMSISSSLILLLFAAMLSLGSALSSDPNEGNLSPINNHDIRWWIDRGDVFFYTGDYNGSLEAYDRALKFDDRNFKALFGKGEVLNALGRYDEALILLEKSLTINSQDAYALREKARALNGLGKFQEALICLNLSVLIQPLDSSAWFERGRTLDDLGSFSQANDNTNLALLIESQSMEGPDIKSVAQAKSGINIEAGEAYSRARAAQRSIATEKEAEADILAAVNVRG